MPSVLNCEQEIHGWLSSRFHFAANSDNDRELL